MGRSSSGTTRSEGDRYDSFDELCKQAVEGRDFQIRTATRPGQVAVIAPHGGGIERGTSELAEAIAGTAFSFYAFEGTRPNNNRDLHITSTRFREPRCDALVAASPLVITIHGEDSDDEAVFVGGLAGEALRAVAESLEAAEFSVETHANPRSRAKVETIFATEALDGRAFSLS